MAIIEVERQGCPGLYARPSQVIIVVHNSWGSAQSIFQKIGKLDFVQHVSHPLPSTKSSGLRMSTKVKASIFCWLFLFLFFLTKAKPVRAQKLQNRTLQGIPRYPFSSCIRIWLQDTHYKFSGHIFVRTYPTITHLPRHSNSDRGRSTQLQGPRTQFVWPVSEL